MRIKRKTVRPQIFTSILLLIAHAEPAEEAQTPVENFTETHEHHDASSEAGPSTPRNKFMFTLTSAAQLYPTRFRSRPSTTLLTPPPPSRPILLDDINSSTPEFIEDDSEDESGFSSEDEYDNELFMDRPTLSKQEAEKLFYNPSEPWSSVSSDPIENPVVIAKLHCEMQHICSSVIVLIFVL